MLTEEELVLLNYMDFIIRCLWLNCRYNTVL